LAISWQEARQQPFVGYDNYFGDTVVTVPLDRDVYYGRMNEYVHLYSVNYTDCSEAQEDGTWSGIVSSGNAWERRSQSYFDTGNGVPRNAL